MSECLVINEIFLSLQGESTFAGVPCIFVRLTGCDLRCSYCDTAYAFGEGRKMSLAEIRAEVHRLAAPFAGKGRTGEPSFSAATGPTQGPAGEPFQLARWPIIEITGGEPLLQRRTLPLMQSFCDDGFTVLIETNGAHDIAPIDPRVCRIMDLKSPSSGEVERNRWENLGHLRRGDEVKFVLGSVQDYDWAKQTVLEHGLASRCTVLFSWVEPLTPGQQHPSLNPVPPGHTPLSRRELAERILVDGLPVRMQVQMHKIIWPKDARGV